MTMILLRGLLIAVDFAIVALWVAVCAVAPEFIWRGVQLVIHHASWGDLLAALLVGLILVCFVEPGMKRLRGGWAADGPAPESGTPGNLLFTASVALVFTLVSFVIHDAVTSFLALHAETEAARWTGLVNGLRIASSWTIVPFCITCAWLGAGYQKWRWPLGALAIVSPVLTALIFSWPLQDWVTTQVPCVLILAAGYRQWRTGPNQGFFRRSARALLWICPLWLVAAVLLDRLMDVLHVGWVDLYSRPEAWIDIRFYLGWLIGLSVAPVPQIKEV